MHVFFDIHILPFYRGLNLCMYNDTEDKLKLSRETMGTMQGRGWGEGEEYWGMLNNKIWLYENILLWYNTMCNEYMQWIL